MNRRFSLSLIPSLALLLIASCSGGKLTDRKRTVGGKMTPSHPPDDLSTEITKLSAGMSFQWQLQGAIDTSHDVDVYDIDLEENEHNGIIPSLKAKGRKVICYFSAGTYENWRSDSGEFPIGSLGKNNGWAGEKWLDIRHPRVREIMKSRIKRAAAAGCDGVDPDNVDGYENNTGFPLTADDQIEYLNYLATTAHNENLSIGLKNAVNIITLGKLDEVFDWALNEECYTYNECDSLNMFTARNKAVFVVDYDDSKLSHCGQASSSGFELMILDRLLDNSYRKECP